MTTTTYEIEGKTYEKVLGGSCRQCPGRKNRDLCFRLPDCFPRIDESGERVTYCWKEVEVEKEEREVEHD